MEGARGLGVRCVPRRYDVAILAELLRLRPRMYELGLDGSRQTVEAVPVAVANTPCYGRGFRIGPAPDPADRGLGIRVRGPFPPARHVAIPAPAPRRAHPRPP